MPGTGERCVRETITDVQAVMFQLIDKAVIAYSPTTRETEMTLVVFENLKICRVISHMLHFFEGRQAFKIKCANVEINRKKRRCIEIMPVNGGHIKLVDRIFQEKGYSQTT